MADGLVRLTTDEDVLDGRRLEEAARGLEHVERRQREVLVAHLSRQAAKPLLAASRTFQVSGHRRKSRE